MKAAGRLKKTGNRLIAGVVCALVSFGLCLTPWGKAWDTFCYDFFFLLRGVRPPAQDIVIVAIDESSFGNLGIQWPWPRSLHAALIDALFAAGARTVAVDILFAESSLPQEDEALRSAIQRHPALVLAADVNTVEDAAYAQQTRVLPHPSLVAPQTLIGYINLPVDPDGFIRGSNAGAPPVEALSVVAAGHFSGQTSRIHPGRSGNINYAGPHRTFKTISYYQALTPEAHLPEGVLKDKLIFVGFSTQNVSDINQVRPDHFPTPFTRWKGGYMSGVEIHANITANLILDDFITIFPTGRTFLIGVLVCGATGVLFFRKKPLAGGVVLLLCWGVIGFTAFILFSRNGLYLPMLYICLPMTSLYMASPFYHYIESRRERNYIRQAFSTYVAPSVVRQLIANPQQLKLGGEERQITAFFSDVEGFSGISERLTPPQLVGLLNEFLTEMTDILLDHKGTVDKFEGDAIIAMFGAPNRLPNHAEEACLACIDMQNRLASLRQSWRDRGLPELKMRIGMCSGPAVVGNMGSKRRMDYTMMGDTVNTASRLEGANKVYRTYCLVGESTRTAAGGTIATREVDLLHVVGKKEALRVYEIVGIPGRLDEKTIQTLRHYENGLRAYRDREWDRAAACFEQALAIMPADGPSRTMRRRCLDYKIHPPGENWTSAYEMTTK